MPQTVSEILIPFLSSPQRPEGTLTFHELQGFLFAVVCSPVLIKPSEWLPMVFNEQDADYASIEEAQSITQALMDTYNIFNTQVIMDQIELPDGIDFELSPLEQVGKATALGQWSRGFFLGHDWLEEMWKHNVPETSEEELFYSLLVLSFFSDRKMAEAYYRDLEKPEKLSLQTYAEKLFDMLEAAMISYANLGRSIHSALMDEEQPSQPYVSEQKVGRNEPCPCGSGKKYKKCCLH